MIGRYLLPLVMLAVTSGASASTINIDTVESGQGYQSRFGIREDTATRGRDLVGMVVRATYVDGSTEEAVWGELRRGGAATGSAFNLFFDFNHFELSLTRALASLSLDARTGNAIFDISRSRSDGEDTFGTKVGYPFSITSANDPAGTIGVSYSGAFSILGHARATDAWTRMHVDFTGLEGGGLSEGTTFRTDLDSLAVAGDFTPVPLPGSMALIASGVGIMGAGALSKRRKSKRFA